MILRFHLHYRFSTTGFNWNAQDFNCFTVLHYVKDYLKEATTDHTPLNDHHVSHYDHSVTKLHS